MQTKTFVRKPFTVEAVQVTTENIADIAEMVGSLRHEDDGTPFIQANRRLTPNIYQIRLDSWVTIMGGNIRCYSDGIFREQFVPSTDDIKKWVNFLNGDKTETEAAPT